MEDSKKRRIRGPNFSNDEKILLLKLVDKYRDILECKRTDGTTWRDKKDTWTRVAREFNEKSYSSERRTAENIKTCYENLKKCTKKMALTNRGVVRPYGGQPCSCNGKYDPVFELTLSILNKTMFRETKEEDGGRNEATTTENEDARLVVEEVPDNKETVRETDTEIAKSIEDRVREIKEETDFYSATEQSKIVADVDDDINEAEESYSQRSETEILSENINHHHYQDLSSLKAEVYRQQLVMLKKEEEYKDKQRHRDEMEFEIEKRRRERRWELEQKSLLLDIKIKEAQLKNINLNLNLI